MKTIKPETADKTRNLLLAARKSIEISLALYDNQNYNEQELHKDVEHLHDMLEKIEAELAEDHA